MDKAVNLAKQVGLALHDKAATSNILMHAFEFLHDFHLDCLNTLFDRKGYGEEKIVVTAWAIFCSLMLPYIVNHLPLQQGAAFVAIGGLGKKATV